MLLQINGEPKTIPDCASVSDLLDHLGIAQSKLAVEINRQIIPHAHYDNTILRADDTVEIIHAVGGG